MAEYFGNKPTTQLFLLHNRLDPSFSNAKVEGVVDRGDLFDFDSLRDGFQQINRFPDDPQYEFGLPPSNPNTLITQLAFEDFDIGSPPKPPILSSLTLTDSMESEDGSFTTTWEDGHSASSTSTPSSDTDDGGGGEDSSTSYGIESSISSTSFDPATGCAGCGTYKDPSCLDCALFADAGWSFMAANKIFLDMNMEVEIVLRTTVSLPDGYSHGDKIFKIDWTLEGTFKLDRPSSMWDFNTNNENFCLYGSGSINESFGWDLSLSEEKEVGVVMSSSTGDVASSSLCVLDKIATTVRLTYRPINANITDGDDGDPDYYHCVWACSQSLGAIGTDGTVWTLEPEHLNKALKQLLGPPIGNDPSYDTEWEDEVVFDTFFDTQHEFLKWDAVKTLNFQGEEDCGTCCGLDDGKYVHISRGSSPYAYSDISYTTGLTINQDDLYAINGNIHEDGRCVSDTSDCTFIDIDAAPPYKLKCAPKHCCWEDLDINCSGGWSGIGDQWNWQSDCCNDDPQGNCCPPPLWTVGCSDMLHYTTCTGPSASEAVKPPTATTLTPAYLSNAEVLDDSDYTLVVSGYVQGLFTYTRDYDGAGFNEKLKGGIDDFGGVSKVQMHWRRGWNNQQPDSLPPWGKDTDVLIHWSNDSSIFALTDSLDLTGYSANPENLNNLTIDLHIPFIESTDQDEHEWACSNWADVVSLVSDGVFSGEFGGGRWNEGHGDPFDYPNAQKPQLIVNQEWALDYFSDHLAPNPWGEFPLPAIGPCTQEHDDKITEIGGQDSCLPDSSALWLLHNDGYSSPDGSPEVAFVTPSGVNWFNQNFNCQASNERVPPLYSVFGSNPVSVGGYPHVPVKTIEHHRIKPDISDRGPYEFNPYIGMGKRKQSIFYVEKEEGDKYIITNVGNGLLGPTLSLGVRVRRTGLMISTGTGF